MKYTFSFKEINYGSIEIEADQMPDRSEVIDAIMNGGAFYGNTEYEDIQSDSEQSLEADGTSDMPPPETIRGYDIKRSIVFENNRGFALAENPEAVDQFVTWQFTEENGQRDYYWGHYCSTEDSATRDYIQRVAEYAETHRLSERDAYKYYATGQPVDIGTFPKTENGPIRFVNFDSREDVEQGRYQAWGYLVYDASLTEKQISDYELKAAPDNPDVKSRMQDMAQVVAAWEDMKSMPDNKRYTWHKPSIQGFALREPVVTPEKLLERYKQAKHELTIADKQAAPKSIAVQLAEGAQQAAKDNATRPAPPTHTDKGDR